MRERHGLLTNTNNISMYYVLTNKIRFDLNIARPFLRFAARLSTVGKPDRTYSAQRPQLAYQMTCQRMPSIVEHNHCSIGMRWRHSDLRTIRKRLCVSCAPSVRGYCNFVMKTLWASSYKKNKKYLLVLIADPTYDETREIVAFDLYLLHDWINQVPIVQNFPLFGSRMAEGLVNFSWYSS